MQTQTRLLKQSHKKQQISLYMSSDDITNAKISNELMSYLKKKKLMLKGDDINSASSSSLNGDERH
jgi:hypothetical protein